MPFAPLTNSVKALKAISTIPQGAPTTTRLWSLADDSLMVYVNFVKFYMNVEHLYQGVFVKFNLGMVNDQSATFD